jgi:hypothetical protein
VADARHFDVFARGQEIIFRGAEARIEMFVERRLKSFHLIGTKSNREGLGARVEIEMAGLRQIDEACNGGSYLSQSDLRLHFGSGCATRVGRLTIRSPSGRVDSLRNGPAKKDRGAGASRSKSSIKPESLLRSAPRKQKSAFL